MHLTYRSKFKSRLNVCNIYYVLTLHNASNNIDLDFSMLIFHKVNQFIFLCLLIISDCHNAQ